MNKLLCGSLLLCLGVFAIDGVKAGGLVHNITAPTTFENKLTVNNTVNFEAKTTFEREVTVNNTVNFEANATGSTINSQLTVAANAHIVLADNTFTLNVNEIDLLGHIDTVNIKNEATKPILNIAQDKQIKIYAGSGEVTDLVPGKYTFVKEGITHQVALGLQSCISEGIIIKSAGKSVVKTADPESLDQVSASAVFNSNNVTSNTTLLDEKINLAANVVDLLSTNDSHNQLDDLLGISTNGTVDISEKSATALDVSIVAKDSGLTFTTGYYTLTVNGDLTNVLQSVVHSDGSNVVYTNAYSVPQNGIKLPDTTASTFGSITIQGVNSTLTNPVGMNKAEEALDFATAKTALTISGTTTIKCPITL